MTNDELLNHASVFQFKRVRVERYRAPAYGVTLDCNRPFTHKWRVIRLVFNEDIDSSPMAVCIAFGLELDAAICEALKLVGKEIGR